MPFNNGGCNPDALYQYYCHPNSHARQGNAMQCKDRKVREGTTASGHRTKMIRTRTYDSPPKNGRVMPIKAVNTTKTVRMTTRVKNLLLIPLRRLKSSIMSNTGIAYICRKYQCGLSLSTASTVRLPTSLPWSRNLTTSSLQIDLSMCRQQEGSYSCC